MANVIALSVTVNAGSATASLVALNTLIAQMGPNAQQASNQATTALNNVNSSVQALQSSLSNLARAAAILGLGKLIQELIMAGDALERLQMGLRQTPGGEQAITALSKAADKLGLVTTDLLRNFTQLRNAGMPMQQAVQTVEALATATRIAHGGQDELNKSITVMMNLYAKGFATGREVFTGFVMSGLVPAKIMMEATGMTITKLRENLRNINVDVLSKLLVDVAKLQNIGKEAGGDLISSWINRIRNSFIQLGDAIDRAFGPGIKLILKIIRDLLDALTDFVNLLGKMPESFRTIIPSVLLFAAALYEVLKVVKLIQEVKLGEMLMEIAAGNKLALAAVSAYFGYKVVGPALFGQPKEGATPADSAEVARLKAEIKQLQGGLLGVDEKAQERADKYAENLLSEAQKRYAQAGKESIEALTFAYQEHFRKVAGFARDVAIVQKALIIDVAAEVVKYTEKVDAEILKSQREQAVLRRKIAINIETTEPDETAAGKALYSFIDAQEKARQIQTQFAEQMADKWKTARVQIEAAMKGGFIDSAEKYFAEYLRDRQQLEKQATDAETEHWTAAHKEAIKALREYEKQQRAEDLRDVVTGIQQSTALRVAVIGTAVPTSPQQRIQQINAVSQAQIQGINDVHDAQMKAAQAEYDIYKKLHPFDIPGQEEAYRTMTREQIRISNEANAEIQLNRINSWNEANRIIMEEQMRVYESIKGLLSQVWDAALDRSKSFWSSLANIIKTTILGAIKEIVTSRLAISLAGLFGYGGYAQRGGLFGITQPPTALGMPNPWAITTGESVQSTIGSYGVSSQGSAQRQIVEDLQQIGTSAQQEAVVSSQGSAERMATEEIAPPAAGQTTLPWDLIQQAGTTPQAQAQGQLTTMAVGRGGIGSTAQTVANLRKSFNIGQPIKTAAGTTISWSSATAGQRLASVLKSPGMGSVAAMVGLPIFMAGVQRRGVLGGAMAVGGGALAGAGLAQMFGMNPIAGAMAGGGIGLMAAGWRKGGAVGLGMDVVGGAVAGAGIGAMIGTFGGPLGVAAGAVIGAGVGAIAGGVEGVVRLFVKTQDERIRTGIKQIYGIDISNQGIRQQIADITNQKFGGNVSIALYSQDVQDIVRLYALSSGQNQAGLPRPMYPATFAQSQAGGLQMQPVYSGGQLVQNPYQGTTTTQLQNALIQSNTPSIFLQMNPQQANALFAGQVVNVLNNNPGAVAQANTTAAVTGSSRTSQVSALMEPLTVTR